MKTAISRSVTLALLFAGLFHTEIRAMPTNQKVLSDARARIKEYEAGLDPERLREAYLALENVTLSQEKDEAARAKLRAECLSEWLHVLELLDRHIDPHFDRDNPPPMHVEPPPTSDGTQYPPGADPALIDDPKARAEYEKAIAANKAKAAEYRRQIALQRIDERIQPRAEAFLRDSFTSSPADREELRGAIEKSSLQPKRKAALLKTVKPPQP